MNNDEAKNAVMWTVPDEDSSLYLRYQTQSDRQPVRLCLDLESREVSCYAWGNIGPGQTMRAFHARDIEWEIPPLRQDAVGRLYARISPHVHAILADSEVEWDGSNWVGRLGPDAELARDAIEQYVETGWEASDCWEPWDASDYFEPVDLSHVGLSASSTDADVERVAAHEVSVADVVLDEDDVRRHLALMVQDARDELEDESC